MRSQIHVNMNKIRGNKKHGTNDPVITCKTYKSNSYAHNVKINGPSEVIYSPEDPLSCGARVWIECDSKYVSIDGQPLEKENKMSSKVNTLNDDGAYIVITREEITDSTDRRAYEMTGYGSIYAYAISIDDENGGFDSLSKHPNKFLALEAAEKYSHKYSLPVMDATETD